MSQLIVIGFDNQDDAFALRRDLAEAQKEYLLKLEDAVVVTRAGSDGRETQQTVDVSAMMSGKRKDDKPTVFFLQPGDRIFVPERLF